MEKIGIFIIARLGSSRLPRKTILDVGGKRAIQWVIDRAKKVDYVDEIVLCTSDYDENRILCKIAEDSGISWHCGSDCDKADRLCGAAEKFGVDFFVCFDGEDLFVSEFLAEEIINQYNRTGADFIHGGDDLAVGAITQGIKTTALQKLCFLKDTNNTEMLHSFFRDTNIFNVEELLNVPDIFRIPELRATMDYYEDKVFFERVIGHFDRPFEMIDVISLIKNKPELLKINSHRNKEWKENQKNNVNVKLIGD